MKLTTTDVERIARLARLDLSEEEKTMYTTELSAILSYVEGLQEVDTTGVEPTSHITEQLENLRADEVRDCGPKERAELVAAFPSSKADLLAVPPVFVEYKA